jgi:hypothetical protein
MTETTLAQAVVGRQLAAGEGFTTPVRYPETLATLRARGIKPDFSRAWPELHQPPLYSTLIGATIAVLPARLSHVLFEKAPVPPDGFGGDYLLLGLNLALLWLAAWLTFLLGRRLFDATAGLIASLGLLASVSVWAQTVGVNGTPLMMVLLLGLFYALARAESVEAGKTTLLWMAAAGAGVFGISVQRPNARGGPARGNRRFHSGCGTLGGAKHPSDGESAGAGRTLHRVEGR